MTMTGPHKTPPFRLGFAKLAAAGGVLLGLAGFFFASWETSGVLQAVQMQLDVCHAALAFGDDRLAAGSIDIARTHLTGRWRPMLPDLAEEVEQLSEELSRYRQFMQHSLEQQLAPPGEIEAAEQALALYNVPEEDWRATVRDLSLGVVQRARLRDHVYALLLVLVEHHVGRAGAGQLNQSELALAKIYLDQAGLAPRLGKGFYAARSRYWDMLGDSAQAERDRGRVDRAAGIPADHLVLARRASVAGAHDEAIALLLEGMRLDDHPCDLLPALAAELQELGRGAEAAALYTALLELHGRYEIFHERRAECLTALGL